MNQDRNYGFRSGGPRPLGITIIAVLVAIGALWALLGGLSQILTGPFAVFGYGGIGHFASKEIAGTVEIVLAVAQLAVAYGLFTLRRWSFWVTVIVEALSLLGAFFGYSGATGGLCAGLLPLVILAYLFLDGNVRRAFRT